MGKIIAVCGYSGSGKSYLCSLIKEKGYFVISTSQIIQKALSKNSNFNENLSETKKFTNATQILKENPNLPAKALKEFIDNLNNKDIIILDGVKSFNDLNLFNQNNIIVLAVNSCFEERLKHIKENKNINIFEKILREKDIFDKKQGLDNIIEKADIHIANSEISSETIEKILKFIN